MTEESEFPLKALLGLPDEEPEEPTEFAQGVAAALGGAIAAMRVEEIIEVEDGNVAALVEEITAAAVEASSLKRLLKRVVNTLVHSPRVEEIYGTDDEISAFLRRFFEGA